MRNYGLTRGAGLVGVIFGIVGIAYAFTVARKAEEVCAKINSSIDEMSSSVKVDVPEALVNAAVEKSVDMQVDAAIRRAANEIVCNKSKEIEDQVGSVVSKAESSIHDDVQREINRQIGKIDIEKTRREVVEKAKRDANEKFRADLDGILTDFKSNLSSVTKIYQTVADTINPKNVISSNTMKEMIFKL